MRDLRRRKQAEEHIRFLAHYDALTGLPNRGSFHKQLDHEIETARGGDGIAVLCLDLDRFKEVNDLLDTRRVTGRFRPSESALRVSWMKANVGEIERR